MSLIDTNLASGTNSDTELNQILFVDSTINVLVYGATFTNLTASVIEVDIIFNDGSDRLLQTLKIPGGVGRFVNPSCLTSLTLSSGQALKLQSTTNNSFNYKVNGAERTL